MAGWTCTDEWPSRYSPRATTEGTDELLGVIDRLEKTEPYLERLASTITSARKANVKIIHVIARGDGWVDLHG
jgi:hypothetical protein